MVLCSDLDCSVCLLSFSRSARVPRQLHCGHAFCQPCLQAVAQLSGGVLTISCPLCRKVTCVRQGRSLEEALWVDTDLWHQIRDRDISDEEGDEKEAVKEECVSPSGSKKKQRRTLRLPSFLRRLSWTKQRTETILTSSNVEMKSWRRLPTDC